MIETIADDLFAPDVMADPYPCFARWRAEDPVHWNSLFNMWEITKHEDVAYVLKHADLFTSDKSRGRSVPYPPIPPEDVPYLKHAGAQGVRMLINHDRPRHTAERALVYDHFSPSAAASWRPFVRSVVSELLDEMASRPRADLLAVVAPLPVRVFLQLMGLPAEDGERLRKLTDDLLGVYGPERHRLRIAYESRCAVGEYFKPFILERTNQPTTDLLSALCRGERTSVWDREDLLANATLLLTGGYQTTMDSIANGTLAFLRHPDQWDRFKADPDGQAEIATEECLRYDSPVRSAVRVATRDVELRGKVIRASQRLRWWVISANRDEDAFDRADAFDIGRTPNPHLTFGTGNHYCMGAHFARMESQEVFTALAHRFPRLRLDTSTLEYHPSVSLRSLASLPVIWS